MCGHKDCNSLCRKVIDQLPEFSPHHRIDPAGRLVEEYYFGTMKDRAAERKTLFQSARERAGDAFLAAVEAGHFEHPFLAFLDVPFRQAVHPPIEIDVLIDGQIFIERKFLGHIADIFFHPFRFFVNIESADACSSVRRLEERA